MVVLDALHLTLVRMLNISLFLSDTNGLNIGLRCLLIEIMEMRLANVLKVFFLGFKENLIYLPKITLQYSKANLQSKLERVDRKTEIENKQI